MQQCGIPQGSILSSLLCNILLGVLDRQIANDVKTKDVVTLSQTLPPPSDSFPTSNKQAQSSSSLSLACLTGWDETDLVATNFDFKLPEQVSAKTSASSTTPNKNIKFL